ncbi:MAG: hypothetical protein J6M15_06030 [Prevotella sp.]|nr:hypothetical protein [Prevotella sp.]
MTFDAGVIPGDADGDGKVNVTDIVSVVNIILSDPVTARESLFPHTFHTKV